MKNQKTKTTKKVKDHRSPKGKRQKKDIKILKKLTAEEAWDKMLEANLQHDEDRKQEYIV